jgi:hypothetical protein
MIVVTGDWDCNKGINNPNGVFSGVTRYNWWSERIKSPNILHYVVHDSAIALRFFSRQGRKSMWQFKSGDIKVLRKYRVYLLNEQKGKPSPPPIMTKLTKNFWEDQSPTFFDNDADLIQNDSSNISSLPSNDKGEKEARIQQFYCCVCSLQR